MLFLYLLVSLPMLITFKMRWLLYINLQLFIALVVTYLISYDYSPLEYGFGLIGPDGNFEYSGFTLYLLLLIVTNLVGVVCKLRGHWSAEVLSGFGYFLVHALLLFALYYQFNLFDKGFSGSVLSNIKSLKNVLINSYNFLLIISSSLLIAYIYTNYTRADLSKTRFYDCIKLHLFACAMFFFGLILTSLSLDLGGQSITFTMFVASFNTTILIWLIISSLFSSVKSRIKSSKYWAASQYSLLLFIVYILFLLLACFFNNDFFIYKPIIL